MEVDIPEYVMLLGLARRATQLDKSTGDLCGMAFYYLLRVGEYTMKARRQASQQTIPFVMGDVSLFDENERGEMRRIPYDAPAERLLRAKGAALRVQQQKNGWKNVSVFHEANGDSYYCPAKCIARQFLHIRNSCGVPWSKCSKLPLATFYEDGVAGYVTDSDIREAIKEAGTYLDYPRTRGIPVERIDTHSLRGGGANALALAGYSDTQIMKMGRWKGATFREYIREELHTYAKGMSRDMKKLFKFVNVAGGYQPGLVDVTDAVVATPYRVAAACA